MSAKIGAATASVLARPRVVIAGNPNTGKTTLFNRLTGSNQKVGNYAGVTVERHSGALALPNGSEIELLDVPGAYSLSAKSREEEIAIQTIAGLPPYEPPDLVVLVVDATQLSRNLYLVLQVLELGLAVVIALNMTDLLAERGMAIDVRALERELGVPIVETSAIGGRGLEELRRAVERAIDAPERARAGARWVPTEAPLLEDIEAVAKALPESWLAQSRESTSMPPRTTATSTPSPLRAARRRALALWALLSLEERDELQDIPPSLRAAVLARRARATLQGRHLDTEVIRGRYRWIDERVTRVLDEKRPQAQNKSERADSVLLNPWVGFPIFLVAMGIVFQSLFSWADPAIHVVEGAFSALAGLVKTHFAESLLRDFVTEGLIAGVGSVLVFLPQILLLFFFIGLMEDTGYMARVAFLMDRLMKKLGLHGRAFVPMISGYACAVPAVMATRTMERGRDRILTMLVIPLMTCSARLPVYSLVIGALFPPSHVFGFVPVQGLMMIGMYLFSTVAALTAAAVLSRTILSAPSLPLILEMPPYRRPHWSSVLRMMWQRSSAFLREAGGVILICTIILWLLLSFPKNGVIAEKYAGERAGLEQQRTALTKADTAPSTAPSANSSTSRTKASTTALTTTTTQSESPAVARLDGELARVDAEEAGEQLRQSYGGRLGRAIEPGLQPLGFDWKIGIGLIGAFAAREVFVSTMGVVYGVGGKADANSTTLRQKIQAETREDGKPVYTPLVGISLMIFFALACQCMSTLATVYRETKTWRWPAFMFAYMTVLAWVASFAVYNIGRGLGLG